VTKVDRPKDWWLNKAKTEPEVPISAGKCEHMEFAAKVNVGRLTETEGGPVTGYTADVTIKCAQCGLPFQFLGLEPGVDTQGARVSLDGLEARIAISPQGVKPNPLQRMSFNIKGFQ
jgi:hypothetical protein